MPTRTTAKKTGKKSQKKASKKKTTRKKTQRATASKATTRKKTTRKATPARAHPWTFPKLMAELKKLGTAQNRKVYARHGAPDSMFGVSFANLYKLQKQIKCDHDLAQRLWSTGNADARMLAALIADHTRTTRAQLDAWAKDIGYFMTADYFASFVARTDHAVPLAKKWAKSRKEMIRRSGYSTINSLLKNAPPAAGHLDKHVLTDYLKTIEREIHDSPNRAREAMNTTLICIGVYFDALHKQAVAAAKRIGKVEIQHGEGTHCKDFIATIEIAKARAYLAKKKKK